MKTSQSEPLKPFDIDTETCKRCTHGFLKVLYPKSGVGNGIVVCLECETMQREVPPCPE